jgi:pimeloyl-ACP methyl ester carboxylesterase
MAGKRQAASAGGLLGDIHAPPTEPRSRERMNLIVPAPSQTFDVDLEDGAPPTAQANQALGTENGYDYDFVPGTGHLLQIEKPAQCVRLVEKFLTERAIR